MPPRPMTATRRRFVCEEEGVAMLPWSGRMVKCQMDAAKVGAAAAFASVSAIVMVITPITAAFARAMRGYGAAVRLAVAVEPGRAIRAEIALALRRGDRHCADEQRQRHDDFCYGHGAISLDGRSRNSRWLCVKRTRPRGPGSLMPMRVVGRGEPNAASGCSDRGRHHCKLGRSHSPAHNRNSRAR